MAEDVADQGSASKRVKSENKWDWLYAVGVDKVIAMKMAGRNQDEIVYERDQHEYTFSPNKKIV